MSQGRGGMDVTGTVVIVTGGGNGIGVIFCAASTSRTWKI